MVYPEAIIVSLMARITFICTMIQVFLHLSLLCLTLFLYMSAKMQQKEREKAADTRPLKQQWSYFLQSLYHPFSSGLFHFKCYPNQCISHGILQSIPSMDRQEKKEGGGNPFWIHRMYFFLLLSSKQDRNRNRKRRAILVEPHSVHREMLITKRQAFLVLQSGLGVFHYAHS